MATAITKRTGSGRARARPERNRGARRWSLAALAGERARWWMLLAFATMIMLGGGGSRHDIASLLYLRPLTFGFMSYALLVHRREDRRALPFPFYLLLALAALVAIQLVPLPPGVWSALPGRSLYHRIGIESGLPQLWRPLSLAPARTWNTLFSLAVPLTAFLLYAVQSPQRRPAVLLVIIAVAVTSVALGLLQVFAGPDSIFYLYGITNVGDPVGLFANRNHEGLVLAASTIACALAVRRLQPADRGAPFKAVLLIGFIILLIPFELILGSRAGAVLSAAGFLIAPWFIFSSPVVSKALSRVAGAGRRWTFGMSPRALAWGIYGALVVSVVALAMLNSRNEAWLRLSNAASDSGDRAAVLPYLFQMIRDFLPWGSGFGSFDALFYQYEPLKMLSELYLNQAHDDWLQILIEGGLPAAALLLAFVVWLGMQVVKVLRRPRAPGAATKAAMLVILFMFGIASAVDYPLRVPICMMIASFVVSLLADSGRTLGWKRS